MAMKSVTHFLDENGVKYVVQQHSPAYTAQEVAEVAHVPGRHFAKSVMVNVDGRLALAVLPATDRVDLHRLAQSLGAQSVELAEESEFSEHFPDCEPGAMPPFGNLFDLEVFVSPHLAQADIIAFSAGNHHEVMQLAYSVFDRLVKPVEVAM
ncbi:Ala-tRNA(Pro) deacylase [Halomonas fontilapidosi]|uniref:Ala-tRNA(Pro) deacylase n=1 Tax=Halomonas fontilapidosi TaxID=616675 RepID=A0A7W5GYP7_9GAMM|nr:YbaK/EbsC family protein [Halomonas fontilapidosi]MBB3183694.1 Ala-tRNA(Pro) deacylase [Halomonas fontilapidosi]